MDDIDWNRRRPISERHVQALWYDGALRPKDLRTTDGLSVRVIDPGAWNVEAGPDFSHAVLEVGPARRRVVGDVEIHLHPSDWHAHGHSSDPAYESVIAHVTWYAAPPDSWLDGLPARCLRICLGDFLRTRPDFSPDEINLTAYPYAHLPSTPRPCEQIFARNPDLLVAVLRQEGRRRLELKARRLKAVFVRTQDRAQAFYAETLAALGYKQNAEPFRRLAEMLPWRELPESQEAAIASLSCVAEMAVPNVAAWRWSNVRPANSLKRRIAAAASLFSGTCPSLLERLDACDLTVRAGQRSAHGARPRSSPTSSSPSRSRKGGSAASRQTFRRRRRTQRCASRPSACSGATTTRHSTPATASCCRASSSSTGTSVSPRIQTAPVVFSSNHLSHLPTTN